MIGPTLKDCLPSLTPQDDIAGALRLDFVSLAQSTLGEAGAAQLQEIARAQTYFLDNALTSLRIYNLNGSLFKQLDGASILGKLLTPLCDCQDCEAATSPGAYLADLLSLARCFLEFADAEFSSDTSESVARSRTLYTTALDLLNSDELQQQQGLCADVIGSLDVQVGQGEWASVFEQLKAALWTISDSTLLKTIVAQVQQVLATDEPITSRFAKAQAVISSAKASIAAPPTLGVVIEERAQLQEQAHTTLLAQPHILEAAKQVGITVGTDYVHALSLVSGVNSAAL
jgi:hypothetical protein